MANYANLKSAIEAVIYENGNQEITGSVMQATLLAMVNSLGAGYQYAGIATPSTNPGTPDQNVFYLASTAGTYVNFGNIVLNENEVAILKYNGSWTKEASGFASAEKVNQLDQEVTGFEYSKSFNVSGYSWPTYDTINVAKGLVYTIKLTPSETTGSGTIFFRLYDGTNVYAEKGLPSPFSPQTITFTPASDMLLSIQFTTGNTGKVLVEISADGIAATKAEVLDAKSELGTNGSYSISNTTTDQVIDVRALASGKYQFALKATGTGLPATMKLYRTSGVKSGIIDSSKYDLPLDGTPIEIELTDQTNYLWLWLNSTLTYDAKFFIVKNGYLFDFLTTPPAAIETIETEIDGIQEEIDAIDDRLDEIQPSATFDKEQTPIRIDEDTFLTSTGATGEHSNYDLPVYDVQGLTKVKIKGEDATSTVRVYGFYNSSVISAANLVGTIGPAMTSSYEYEVSVPAGAKYMACSKYYLQSLNVTTEVTEPDNSPVQEILVANGNSVKLALPSGNHKLYIEIAPTEEGTGNGLIDIRQFGYMSPYAKASDGYTRLYYANTSDCFMPFKIKALENIDGDDPTSDNFTGGSHQYSNAVTGSTKTARLGNVEIRVDGVKRTNFSGHFDTLEMMWEAFIQANNTKKSNGTGREVLKEIITLRYVNGEFLCRTELVPLEDINIYLWYGYAFYGLNPGGLSIGDHWKYIDGAERGLDETESGNVNTKAMVAYTDKFHQEMWVDTAIDLGQRELVPANITNGAFKSGTKGYFRIIDGNHNLNAGDHYYLYGKYIYRLEAFSGGE